MTNIEIEQLKSDVHEFLRYEPETGDFFWIKRTGARSAIGNKTSQCVNREGYRLIALNKKSNKAHRLAWLYVHGVWPNQIDHINGIKTDNRIDNLRDVDCRTNSHNQRVAHKNNGSGFLGVCAKASGSYQAAIRIGGKRIYLGRFASPELAHEAYLTAKCAHHPSAPTRI